MPNFAFTRGLPLPDVEDGHVFERYNFCQAVPHTKIFEGKKGLVFRNCNLTNCDVPEDAVVEGTVRSKHRSFCSHEHPRWVAKGLPECSETCEHLVDTDELKVDGVTVYKKNLYKDKKVD